jgi:hypothetical protein
LVSEHKLKDGRKVGAPQLASITPGIADKLFERLKERDDGGERTRTAVLAMSVCRVAWHIAWRDKSKIVPHVNPFRKMGLEYEAKQTRAVTHNELERFVTAADAMPPSTKPPSDSKRPGVMLRRSTRRHGEHHSSHAHIC